MVTQTMLRTNGGLYRILTVLSLIKCLKQTITQILLLTCASSFDLPSNIRTMNRIGRER